MKKIIAINASPRTGWNTASLVREVAKGAEAEGAEVKNKIAIHQMSILEEQNLKILKYKKMLPLKTITREQQSTHSGWETGGCRDTYSKKY